MSSKSKRQQEEKEELKSQKVEAKEQLQVEKQIDEKEIEAKKLRTEKSSSVKSESESKSQSVKSVEAKNETVTKREEEKIQSAERRKSSVKKVEEKKSEEKKSEEKKTSVESSAVEVKKTEEVVKKKVEKSAEKKVEEKQTQKVVEEKKVEEKKAVQESKSQVAKLEEKKQQAKEEKKELNPVTKTQEERKQSVDDAGSATMSKKASLVPQIQVDREASPTPTGEKKGSIPKVPFLKEPDGRKGSVSPAGSRRGSFLINQDGDKNELGASLKKAPPRRGSDARRGSGAEDDPAEKPSIPLKPCPGPAPKFIDFQPNQSGTEGKTAAILFTITGDPVPTFQFYKDDTEIFEGGRYVLVTDGSSNNIVRFCVRKSKVNDEGRYKFVATNKHGSDTAEITLFVGGEEGMDFRAMLRKGKKTGPKKGPDDPDFGNLKGVETERKASIKETKVRVVSMVWTWLGFPPQTA